MKTRIIILAAALLGFSLASFAQHSFGTLAGYITDSISRKPLEYATVALMQDSHLKMGTITDEKGYYILKPLPPGKYDLKISYMGYGTIILTGIAISTNAVAFQHAGLKPKDYIIGGDIEIFATRKPLVKADDPPILRFDPEDINTAPVSNWRELVSLAPGVHGGSFHGQRVETSAYYIDGVKVTGLMGLSKSAIQEISVMASGLPAEYGDVLGGVVVVVTKNPLNCLY